MPIMISLNPLTGEAYCDCCRLNLHHCKKCWTKYHNSHHGTDFVAPEYYGEPFIDEDVTNRMEEEFGVKREVKVRPNKDREYQEGDYCH